MCLLSHHRLLIIGSAVPLFVILTLLFIVALPHCENNPRNVSLLMVNSPRGVDPDDANVTEENTLFVFLVLAGAAFLPPVGRVAELRCGTLLLHRGARDGEGGG